jgi:DNA-binding PadR family transcriptional regulator
VVRREFATSVTPYWSASAGSIYPVIARLTRQGLVRRESTRWGERTRARYRITRTGLATLRRWLGPPLPETAAAPAFDAIRTRAGFLRVLSPAQRRRFIATAIAQTEHALARIRELIPTLVYGDDLERIATTGVIDELSARLRWLARLRRAVA